MALQSALADPPDLILLDINMPEMNGFEVCRRLKADEATRDVPVIFISALTETLDKIKAFNAGGVDYVTKPFQFEEVHARIGAHLKLVRAQQELEEKNRAIEQAMDDLKAAQKRLVQSEKLAALGVLVAGIAHEINNPVNFIKTSTLGLQQDLQDMEKLLWLYEELEKGYRDSSMRDRVSTLKSDLDYDLLVGEIGDMIGNIQEGVRRTEDIVDSLRLYSRTDRPDTARADLNELINKALVILHNRYKKQVVVEKDVGRLPLVTVNPSKLIQVVINLVSNALDALKQSESSDQGRINITTGVQDRQGEPYAVIEIADNGPGMPEAIQDKIFDPFFTTKEVGAGTGLGLSISYGIIREHKGKIEFKSVMGKGTTFTILLPVNREAEEDEG